MSAAGPPKVQWWGEFFDGSFGVARSHPQADWNYNIPKLGHSGAFQEKNFALAWIESGLAEWLKVA